MLTIGPNGKIKAQVFAKAVVVQGEVRATSPPRSASTSATPGRWTAIVGTAHRDRRRRALPRQHRHAEAGQRKPGEVSKPAAEVKPAVAPARGCAGGAVGWPRRSAPRVAATDLTCRGYSSGAGGRPH